MASTNDTPQFKIEFGRGGRLKHESVHLLMRYGYYRCTRCAEIKPLDHFPSNGKGKLPKAICRHCQGPAYRERSIRRRAYHREYTRKRRQRIGTPVATRTTHGIVARYRTLPGIPVHRAGPGGYIYVIRMSGMYKIGKTVNLSKRIAELKGFLPLPIETIHTFSVANGLSQVESGLHRQFTHRRLNGEWFRLTDEDVATLKNFTAL